MAYEVDGRLAHVLERGLLIVGVKTDYPPWGMLDDQGAIVGLEADLAHDLGRRLGIAVQLAPVTTANRQQRLEQGHVDIVIATLGATLERHAISDLIQPYYYTSGVHLLAHNDLLFTDWGELRGRPVCLTEGSYYNRALSERFLIVPVAFSGVRDTQLALRDGRCVGWAYDDTVLAQTVSEDGWKDYSLSLSPILQTPWAIAVRKGEGDRSLGRFVSDSVADWHRSGYLLERQRHWGLPGTRFLNEQHMRWRAVDSAGELLCQRQADGYFPQDCLRGELLAGSTSQALTLPPWVMQLKVSVGLDLGALFDPYYRSRLLTGVWLTLAISVVSVVGALLTGVVLVVAEHRARRGVWLWCIRAPSRMLVACARMTPPILQLYIVFFGLSSLLSNYLGITLSSFVVASVVFSVYAGASNAAILLPALIRSQQADPQASLSTLLIRAVEQTYESLVSIMVNIVKAAGMASTIALPEVISAVNGIISEGGDATSLMTLLLVFYFSFVLVVMALLNLLKRWVAP
ncbi:MAG: transporter substrate-binding domain-containing protein [Alcaligenaceae bacterium]|nr:transporter substrate-binding domain-containing protein [Alcaligenaceae bacterium]